MLFDAGRTVSFDVQETVFRTGDDVRSLYLVIAGEIDLVRHTARGTPLLLARAHPGSVLAEASAYASHYHCDGVANSRSRLKSIPVSVFRDGLNGSPATAQAWARHLSHALQKARMQSEIRSLNTVAERLDAWLADANVLPPKGQIQEVARILGVSREALYRELARRR
ncbi:MAG: Crp/Fnr family transcriptional regulator [Pseudomonadota bacterium]